jgi:hypothetical protein
MDPATVEEIVAAIDRGERRVAEQTDGCWSRSTRGP